MRTDGEELTPSLSSLSLSLSLFSPPLSSPPPGTPSATVVLVHGWSASRRSFDPVVPGLLRAGCRVLAYDQRWHGDSAEKGCADPGACHVARLAVDLEGVLDAVLRRDSSSGSSSEEPALRNVTCVGTSLGAAVLWSHYELFRGGKASGGGGEEQRGEGEASGGGGEEQRGEGEASGGGGEEQIRDGEATATATTAAGTTATTTSSKATTTPKTALSPLPPPRIHRVVYVDQAPLQNRTPDWSLGSKGCYDAETLAGLQAAVHGAAGPPGDDGGDGAFARGNAEACLSMPIPADLDALMAAETNKADREALARLMADHTQGDWRAVVRGLDRQEALVVAGSESRIFPVGGCRWVASHAPRAQCVVFRGCGHWLYVERPDDFAILVARFAVGGLDEVEGGWV